MTTVHTLIIVTLVQQWCIFQFDVKNAFLNGDLQEEVYVEHLPNVSHDFAYAYNLRKALYGLKQAPCA